MLTVPEAARRAKRDPETIRRWIRAGKLIAWKVGTQYMVDEDDLGDAIRGVFSVASAPIKPGRLLSDRTILSALHQNRAERAHELHEAMAPYLAGDVTQGDHVLTVPEAARRAHRNPETVRRWIREGKLHATKVGTQLVLEERDLAAFLGEPDTVPLPDTWRRTFWGGPMPDVVSAVRRTRREH
jgi:excisionase family DNA binding protein